MILTAGTISAKKYEKAPVILVGGSGGVIASENYYSPSVSVRVDRVHSIVHYGANLRAGKDNCSANLTFGVGGPVPVEGAYILFSLMAGGGQVSDSYRYLGTKGDTLVHHHPQPVLTLGAELVLGITGEQIGWFMRLALEGYVPGKTEPESMILDRSIPLARVITDVGVAYKITGDHRLGNSPWSVGTGIGYSSSMGGKVGFDCLYNNQLNDYVGFQCGPFMDFYWEKNNFEIGGRANMKFFLGKTGLWTGYGLEACMGMYTHECDEYTRGYTTSQVCTQSSNLGGRLALNLPIGYNISKNVNISANFAAGCVATTKDSFMDYAGTIKVSVNL